MCVCVWISCKYVVQLMLTLKFVMTSTGGGGRSQTSVTLLLVEWITRRFWGVGSPEGAGRWGLSTYHLYEEYTVLVFSFSGLSVGCCINSIYEYWLYILALIVYIFALVVYPSFIGHSEPCFQTLLLLLFAKVWEHTSKLTLSLVSTILYSIQSLCKLLSYNFYMKGVYDLLTKWSCITNSNYIYLVLAQRQWTLEWLWRDFLHSLLLLPRKWKLSFETGR